MGCSCHMTRGHWSFTQFKSRVLDNAMCIVGGQKERVQMKHTHTPELVESHYVLQSTSATVLIYRQYLNIIIVAHS